ncbi:MAG TPA: glycosyltransferase, partial [Flavipsychrobacter sp.]
ILPSVGPGETWGLAINEALASGKYVVATTKTGGAVDLIKDNVNGLIVEPNDITAASEYIANLAGGKQEAGSIAENKRILEQYSFNKIVQQLKQLLLSLPHK